MRNPFKRRNPAPPPPMTRFPEEWVTLFFTGTDIETGRPSNIVESFDSEEEAANYLRGRVLANGERSLEGFKGAYREIPGFLGRLDVPREVKKAAPFPDLVEAAQELEELKPLQELEEPRPVQELRAPEDSNMALMLHRATQAHEPEPGQFAPWVVLTRAVAEVPPDFKGGYTGLAGAQAAGFLATEDGEVSADVYEHVAHYPKAKP